MNYVVFRKNEDGSVTKLGTHESERGAKISLAAYQKREKRDAGSDASALREVSEKFYRTRVVQNILVSNITTGEIFAIPNDTPMVQASAMSIPKDQKTAYSRTGNHSSGNHASI